MSRGLAVFDGASRGRLLQEDGSSLILAGEVLAGSSFGGETQGTLLDGTNSIYELHNGSGVSSFQQLGFSFPQSLPAVGDGWARFAGNTRTAKDTSSLPGAVNGGTALTEWYTTIYIRLYAGLPTLASRCLVVEEAGTGTDITAIRVQTDGTFRIGDGSTFPGSGSTRVLSQTDWTRLDLFCSQRDDLTRCRVYHSENLNASPHETPNEEMSFTLTSNAAPQVWGIGNYAGNTNGFEFGYAGIGTGTWLGAPEGARDVSHRGFGAPSHWQD